MIKIPAVRGYFGVSQILRDACSIDEQPDAALIDLTRQGSDSAFAELVGRHWQPLMRHVTPMVGADQAEDVVQTTFLKAYVAICHGSFSNEVKPWLHRVGHNGAIDALRDRSRSHLTLTDQGRPSEGADSTLERAQRLREIIDRVNALPERQREALVERELGGASYVDIAGKLNTSPTAVRQLLMRARETLRASAAALVPWGLLGRLGGAPEGSAVLVGGTGPTGARLSAATCTAAAVCTGLLSTATLPAPVTRESRTAGADRTPPLASSDTIAPARRRPTGYTAARQRATPRPATRPGSRPRSSVTVRSRVEPAEHDLPAPPESPSPPPQASLPARPSPPSPPAAVRPADQGQPAGTQALPERAVPQALKGLTDTGAALVGRAGVG